LTSKPAAIQFWDTSALISILFREKQSAAALKARDEGRRWVAWDWIRIEAHSALVRRGGKAQDLRHLQEILDQFEFLSIDPEEYPALKKILDRHKLRSADAGHLYCLLKAGKLLSGLSFVCFDEELVKAARTEGIPVFG
jgi:predicted nucleic acid-binding protein